MAKVGEAFYPEYGRPAWYDGNDEDVPRGFYPVNADGSTDFATRLRWVDETPDDPDDNTGHFQVMRPEPAFGYSHRTSRGEPIASGAVVPLEAHAKGKAGLGARLLRALRINYIVGRRP